MFPYKNLTYSLVKLLITASIFYVIFRSIEIKKFINILQSTNILYLFFSLGFLLLNLIIGFLRWDFVLIKFDQERLRYETIKLYFLAFFYNVYLPGGFLGDVVRGYKTANNELNKTTSFILVILDRLWGLYGIIIIGLITILVKKINGIPQYLEIIIYVSYLLLILFPLIFFSKSIKEIINSNNKKGVLNLVKNFLQISNNLFKRKENIIILFSYAILTGLTNILAFYYAGKAVNIHASIVFYSQLIPFVLIVSVLPISYKGLGLRESIIITLFSYQSYNPVDSFALSIIYSINIFITGLIAGFIYGFYKYLSSNK